MTPVMPVGPGEPGEWRIHWGLLSVALVPLSILAAKLDFPRTVVITMTVLAGMAVFLALGLLQRVSRMASDAFSGYMHRLMHAHRAREAQIRCSEAAEVIQRLLAGSERNGGFFPVHSTRIRGRQIIGVYERLHRASVVHAVELAIDAGATDEGTLALAEHPRDIAALNALQAGLLRMVMGLRL